MAITWNDVNKVFTATAEAGLGDSWATAYNEDSFFNVGGQAGVTKPAGMPAGNIYEWVSRIEISAATYFWFKNSAHLVEVVAETENQRWIELPLSDVGFLRFGELVGGYPQDGISVLIDDTNFLCAAVVRGSNNTLTETYYYDSDIRSVKKGSAAVSKFGLIGRNLIGEIKNVVIAGFKYGIFMNKTNNQFIIDRLQITNSGLSAGFHHMAELLTPPKAIFLFGGLKGLEGHGAGTPNIDFWGCEVSNLSTFDIGTAFNDGITIRAINCTLNWSNVYINSNSNPQAIEDCRTLKIYSDPFAKVYLKDPSGLNALQVYSGSKLTEALDNSETLIDVDDGTKFDGWEDKAIKVNMEHMLYNSRTGNTLNVTREYNGTTATAHPNKMWIWKVPDFLILDVNGDISENQPTGNNKDYIVFQKSRWDTTALTLTDFSNHKIRIEKNGFQVYEDILTEYPTKGIEKELALTPSKVNVDQEVVMA